MFIYIIINNKSKFSSSKSKSFNNIRSICKILKFLTFGGVSVSGITSSCTPWWTSVSLALKTLANVLSHWHCSAKGHGYLCLAVSCVLA